MYWFQFQTGSIKRKHVDGTKVGLIMFQFQTGSIKSTGVDATQIDVRLPFQFQTGSIKRKILRS